MKTEYILLVIALFFALDSQAQRKPRYKADKIEYHGRGKVKFRKLLGNVVFTHESTIVKCDSAYQYPRDNRLEAFGRVHIKDGDSVTITSKRLTYEGADRLAKLRENVVYRNGSRTLFTDFLDYDLNEKIANFSQNGRLVDDDNTLTSSSGIFFSQTDYAIFYKNVKLVSPNYDLEADTLEYSTSTKIALTKGPTTIITDDDTQVYAQGGEFKTAVEITIFEEGQIETEEYILEGDELFLDDETKYYTAIGNVKLTSKEEDIIIIGEKGVYRQKEGRSKIFGNPVMKKLMEQDTFFLSADTLVAIENDIEEKKRILAYFDVKFFKSNLQGKCDSMSYFLSDSTIVMYDDPILWNKKSQIEADSIDLILANDVIHKMVMRKNSFLASEDTLGQFNQMKGRSMIANFEKGEINSMDINGNGESLYFALEGDTLLLGMNRILCSSMKINFKNGEPSTIRFYNQPEAELIPPHELTPGKSALEGFVWRAKERPTLPEVVAYYRSESSENNPEEEITEGQIEAAKELINKNNIKTPNQIRQLERNKFQKLTPTTIKPPDLK